MEWIGYAHNDAIRYILKKMKNEPTIIKNKKAIKKLVTEYFENTGFGKQPVKSKYPSPVAADELLVLLRKQLPLQKLLPEIERLENQVTKKILDEKDLLFFYSMAAIARHSAILWAPVDEGGEGVWPITSQSAKYCPYVEGYLADAKSYHEHGPFGFGYVVHDSIQAYVNAL
mgnify:CR=1 FL=1